jgi:hypothetical protein
MEAEAFCQTLCPYNEMLQSEKGQSPSGVQWRVIAVKCKTVPVHAMRAYRWLEVLGGDQGSPLHPSRCTELEKPAFCTE